MKLWIKIVIGVVVVAVILAAVLIPVKVIQGNAAATDLKKALLAQRLLDFEAAILLQKGYEESQQGIIDQQGEIDQEAIEQRNELEDENARMAAEAAEHEDSSPRRKRHGDPYGDPFRVGDGDGDFRRLDDVRPCPARERVHRS